MTDYRYLIIGGGMTAAAALDGIREVDREGSIGVFGAEPHPPYNRPPLTKKLWMGKPLEIIWRQVDQPGVELHLGRKVETIDPQKKNVIDDQGNSFTYDKLLVATGGTPRKLPFGEGKLIYYRTLDDYFHLRELTDTPRRFAVIGGGFIGSEIAAALTINGQQVVMVFPEEGIGSLVYPRELASFLNQYYQEKGVEVLAGELLEGVESRGDQVALRTRSGKEILADHIVAGIGIRPNTELAETAGLQIDNGILVDETLRTSQPDIYAAGDVASFFNPALQKRLRVEHEDNANTMGKTAGQNMAAHFLSEHGAVVDAPHYDHLPFFYSDLFDLGYEAVGDLNSKLETVADWQEPFRKGVIYYLGEGRVRGVLLWNVWDQVDSARKLIAEPGPFDAQKLKGRLPA